MSSRLRTCRLGLCKASLWHRPLGLLEGQAVGAGMWILSWACFNVAAGERVVRRAVLSALGLASEVPTSASALSGLWRGVHLVWVGQRKDQGQPLVRELPSEMPHLWIWSYGFNQTSSLPFRPEAVFPPYCPIEPNGQCLNTGNVPFCLSFTMILPSSLSPAAYLGT